MDPAIGPFARVKRRRLSPEERRNLLSSVLEQG
jgi:hypothetical protein